jgi:protein-disulfide isomerase
VLGAAVVGGIAVFYVTSGGAAIVPTGPIPQAEVDAAASFPGYVEGADAAPVEVIEFADFQCPACKQAWVLTVQDVKQRLVPTGQVKYTFRDFPLSGHPFARQAHHAAACAAEQDLFWQMHDQLFLNQEEWSFFRGAPENKFLEYATAVGANVPAYETCMAEGRYRARIQASVELGVTNGVTGTPSFVIGGRLYQSMAYDQLKAIVDSIAASQAGE